MNGADDYLVGIVLDNTDYTEAYSCFLDNETSRLFVSLDAWYSTADGLRPAVPSKLCPTGPQVFIAEFRAGQGALRSYIAKSSTPVDRTVGAFTQCAIGGQLRLGHQAGPGLRFQGRWGEICFAKTPVAGDAAKMAEILLRTWGFPA